MDFLSNFLILACIYMPVAMSTSLLVGTTGIFSISQAAIFGIGAYGVGALTISGAAPFSVALVLAMGLCVLVNIVFALPALRVAGDYFVVTSFGLQLVASTTFESWTSLTGGTVGLPGIPPPVVFGYTVASQGAFVIAALVLVAVAAGVFRLLRHSAFGRLLTAIRQDELAVAASGKSVLKAKVCAAGLAGAFAAVGGGFYAAYVSFVDPNSFNLDASILIIAMVVVGGARTLAGAVIGPLIITGLPLLLTFVSLPSAYAAPVRQLAYGLLLIVFMLFRPEGIASERHVSRPQS